MTVRNEERLELAKDVLGRMADPALLTPLQARSFVRCLQNTWRVDQIAWGQRDTEQLLADGWRILHAAMVVEEIEGRSNLAAQQLFQRAGELFEWLARSNDDDDDRTIQLLISSGAYQLAGLPAMATSLLQAGNFAHDGEKLFAAFLQGDFDRVIYLATNFWKENLARLAGQP